MKRRGGRPVSPLGADSGRCATLRHDAVSWSQGIGLETVKAALAAGHRVRAFARSAGKIDLSDPGGIPDRWGCERSL
jgi:hypothetical protein